MEELRQQVKNLQQEIVQSSQKIDLEKLVAKHKKLLSEIADAGLWQNSAKAQETTKREADLKRRIEPWQKLKTEINDLVELIDLKDPNMISEIKAQLGSLEQEFTELKRELRFQGPYDDHDVILGIYAGAGGTDAQDWAQMLRRMYLRYAENHSLKADVIDESAGEEAGLKSATVKITSGNFLYGKLAGEHGVHRLVRLSPFNADHKRQTSFAKVDIMPLIDKPSEVQVDDKDLKIDVFRAGGHGGQSVNTTDSAVRVTHIPTGISVAIQNERSQLQNKETALSILKSKLIALQLEQHAQNLAEIKGPNQSAEWGNQIRSYVLHPYKQVKDLRSGYETSDPEKILNGDLDPLIDAWLDTNHG